ncbi:CrcB family protein [Roseiconus nitratireducens]|uniref:Fluoride-specific ion channel FluC n=1 Tax=Roseiconus nitratireducens TaxID=2605748 RepID=A0A5M6D1R8_9BACT|nr:CrcB family protein [Roseiconus nitratireducens]KAA5540956.1 CrcB family protein [Roseiconus nitratireducens]
MTTWFNLAAIAAAGATGSLCRYGVTLAAAAIPGGSSLWGTTLVNILGCAIFGVLASIGDFESAAAERFALALRVGFVGSFTTFSAFAGESAMLAGQARWGASSIYLLSNLVLGWLALLVASELVKAWMQG